MGASVSSIGSSSGGSFGIDNLSAYGLPDLAGVDQKLMKLINKINQMMNMLQHCNMQQNPAPKRRVGDRVDGQAASYEHSG